MSEKKAYKRVSYSLTQEHMDRLEGLANRRTLSNSAMIRTLIDEEWKRVQQKEKSA